MKVSIKTSTTKLTLILTLLIGGFLAGRLTNRPGAIAEADGARTDESFPCADANGSGDVDISDPIYTLAWLFLGGPAPVCNDDPRIQEMEAQVEALQTQLEECLNDCQNGADRSLPATGLELCYDDVGNLMDCEDEACPGQDGLYQKGCGPEGRFTHHGDGTVTDYCTGLTWQKETADTNADGWIGFNDMLDWCAALAYCEDLSLGGEEDWRLPNIRELLSLVDYGRIGDPPVIDPAFGAESSRYWSSTTVAGGEGHTVPDIAMFVYFGGGGSLATFKSEAYHVRAVRGP